MISQKQTGFKSGESYFSQLLFIIYETYKSLDEGYEVRGLFSGISKTFDKLCHGGLLFKLKENKISGNLLNVLKNLQKTTENKGSRISQGSILGLIMFLNEVKKSMDNVSSNPKLFVDDTS